MFSWRCELRNNLGPQNIKENVAIFQWQYHHLLWVIEHCFPNPVWISTLWDSGCFIYVHICLVVSRDGKKWQYPGASYAPPLGKHINSGMLCIMLNAYSKVFSYELHILICGSTGNCSQETWNLHYFFLYVLKGTQKIPLKLFPSKCGLLGREGKVFSTSKWCFWKCKFLALDATVSAAFAQS